MQKALAQLGLGSRREAEAWIRAGRLSVNGSLAQLGMRVRPEDKIRLDGRLVRQRAPPPEQVFLCHRSPGEALATPDETPRDPLMARLPRTAGRRFIAVSPMPRIDGGLELVTSDGALAARLQRAVRLLTIDFSVRVLGELTAEQLERLHAGILDQGEPLTILSCEAAGGEGVNRWYALAARGASGKRPASVACCVRASAPWRSIVRSRVDGFDGWDRGSCARSSMRQLSRPGLTEHRNCRR